MGPSKGDRYTVEDRYAHTIAKMAVVYGSLLEISASVRG